MSNLTDEEKKNVMIDAYAYGQALSEDPHYKVGAILIQPSGSYSSGANASPIEWDHSKESFPWGAPGSTSKYPFVIHAEVDAIVSAYSVDGPLFVTGYPCIECAKLIVAVGIKEVFYAEEPQGPTAYLAKDVEKLFYMCGVKLSKVEV